ncbi:hypothetical protein BGZ80_004523 [Entomortierella chlamydospora]|uniref:F-box/LRR-repeat protein 15/At3g58940/PEG3-like LRR domain-containing protein n=1 Tax=Entomortierella chlamydospora TaxID=101097 RepID=A0A9P6N5J4_9FUNG|nr:hypothetical protein BGZ80_004523 [Entomortierella chlamydospora]
MEHNLGPTISELQPYTKQHALHIPEIADMIVSHLTSTEILFCRGVSKDWCRIFSPFLKLHAIYWNHGALYKARFEERLETLGPFVQSLKEVYPSLEDDLSQPETHRLLSEGQDFTRYPGHMSLASYQVSLDSESTLPATGSGQTIGTERPPCGSLRVLEVGIAAHSMAFPVIEWDLLEAVLTRHQLIKDLTLREAHLIEASDITNSRGISWARSVGIIFGQQAQQKWGAMLRKLKGGNGGANGMEYLSDSILGIAAPEPSVFNHLEALVLDNIKVSEELFVNVLSRCPSLKTLSVRLTGVEIPTRACSHGPEVYFSDVESENIVLSQAPHPGYALVSLELCCDISIANTGVRCVMSHCRSLERLVLRLLYFTDWIQGLEQSTPFPEWSCGESLKSLELQTIYRRRDQQFDERTHLFMNRLKDLKVLEKLILPGKLLGDLSESGIELYAAFRDLLARLDIRDNQDFARAQRQSVIFTCDTNQEATDLQHQQLSQELGYQHAKQCHVWTRDGSGPVNFIPQMPSVKNVTLTSPSDTRFALEMRHLHILMEALPGVRTIWTSKKLYGIDCIPRFNYFYNRFQELYGLTGVELNLGFSVEENWI